MKRCIPALTTANPTRVRAGVTLSEVLVSVVIMSIGVVLLSTLLPISILRTAQATQLTQAVFLRNNAEALIESNMGATITSAGVINPLGVISNQQICGTYGYGIIDPLGYFLTSPNSTSAAFGEFSLNQPFLDGNTKKYPIIRSTGGIFLPSSVYGGSGYLFNVSVVTQPSSNFNLASQAAAVTLADQMATLPDSWTAIREDTVTAFSAAASTVTMRLPTTDVSARNGENPLNAAYRVVLFDISGKFAVIRNLYRTAGTPTAGTPVGTNQLSWQNVNSAGTLVTSPGIPSGFVPARARIEVRDRHFTWLMTVRKRWTPTGSILGPDNAPGILNTDDDNRNGKDDIGETHISASDDDQNWSAEIDVAVFFNRSFKPAEETAHTISQSTVLWGGSYVTWGFDGLPGVAGVDDNNDGHTDWLDPPTNSMPDTAEIGWLGSDDNRTLLVSVANKPYLKKGGFMLEPSQLKWYRIINVSPTPVTISGVTYAMILLDQDLRSLPASPQGIFMKGIVEVYSIGDRTGQQ